MAYYDPSKETLRAIVSWRRKHSARSAQVCPVPTRGCGLGPTCHATLPRPDRARPSSTSGLAIDMVSFPLESVEAVRGDFFGMRSEMIRASEQTQTAAAWRQYQERP